MTNQPASDTPRTDAFLNAMYEAHKSRGLDDFEHYFSGFREVTGFLRDIERELTRLYAERETMLGILQNFHFDTTEPENVIRSIIEGNIQATATLADRDRQLAEALRNRDEWMNAATEAKRACEDSQRQKAELEGRLELAIRELGVALIPLAVLKITEAEKPYAEHSPGLKDLIRNAHDSVYSSIQSLCSTQTEEKK